MKSLSATADYSAPFRWKAWAVLIPEDQASSLQEGACLDRQILPPFGTLGSQPPLSNFLQTASNNQSNSDPLRVIMQCTIQRPFRESQSPSHVTLPCDLMRPFTVRRDFHAQFGHKSQLKVPTKDLGQSISLLGLSWFKDRINTRSMK